MDEAQDEATVKAAAAKLDSWLDQQAVGVKPIFVISHVPLHYSLRARNKGDAQYAQYLVDVLNAAGQRGLNIIFLYSHNHGSGYNNYMGGSTGFVARGESLWVPDTAGTALPPVARAINFTYMNAGFASSYGSDGSTDGLTMSVFQISEDDVTITRYDANGVYALQNSEGTWGSAEESSYGYTLDTTTCASPCTVYGNSVAVSVPQTISAGSMRAGLSETVSVTQKPGCTYTWESSNSAVASVSGNDDGTATITALSAGTTMIRVTESSAAARSAVTNVTEFYVTVEGSTEVFYRLTNGLTAGKRYIFADSADEGTASILMAAANGIATTMKNGVTVHIYNSGIPHIRPLADANETDVREVWLFQNANADGYGQLQADGRTSMLGFKEMTGTDEPWVEAQVLKAENSPDSLMWTYIEDTGLVSDALDHEGKTIQLAHFIHEDWNADYWAAVSNGHFDRAFFDRVYAYEETPLTYTLEVSDRLGQLAAGASGTAQTGSMIVKTCSTGQVEYFPVTADMLSVGTSAKGTYTNVTVTYDGIQVCSDYTLVVGGGNTISVAEGYYYRLTKQFVAGASYGEQRMYLVLDRNAKGEGVMMESVDFTGTSVKSTWVLVDLDADGVPCVRSSRVTNALYQEWMYHKHSDGKQYLFQPDYDLSDGQSNNYLRVAATSGGNLVSGPLDTHALTDVIMRTSSSLGNYTTVYGTLPEGGNAPIYVQYEPSANQFVGVLGGSRVQGKEVFIYEKVSYNTAEVSALSTSGQVAKKSAATARTGTGIQITYPDGRVETVPVTVDMLFFANGNQLTAADITDEIRLTGLTLKYHGVTVATDYVLDVLDFVTTNYPNYPEPGSVRVDKDVDTSGHVYDETGVARIDLSTTGVPMNEKLDVLVIVDTSSSVELHRMDNGETRIEAMRQALDELIDVLATPNSDGSLPDVNMAVSEFSDYNYFGAPNTVNAADTASPSSLIGKQPAGERSSDASWNALVQGYTNIQEMQNFNSEVLQSNGGTNYDAAFQVAYEIVAARKANYPEREQIVIFMTDGMTYQYNYLSHEKNADEVPIWGKWLYGTMTPEELAGNVPTAAHDFYNPDNNKLWMPEAIKGSPSSTYKVIWNENRNTGSTYSKETNIKNVAGLGATVFSIGFGIYVDGEASLRVSEKILTDIASDPTKYYKADKTDELHRAFRDIGHSVRKASTDAYMMDQMGEKFDLQMGAVKNSNGVVQTLRPTITVKNYDLYRTSEVGTVVDGVLVTPEMVGTRKSDVPCTVLETVTFNDAGTQAYSDQVDVNGDGVCDTNDNILVNGIITARYFQYNTNKTADEDDMMSSLPPETFYWTIGDITEHETVLSYYVYLENAMGEDNRGVATGTYETNTYADLHYNNAYGAPCVQHTVSPTLPWNTAAINYAFYLVDENGNIIINEATGETGSFVNRIPVTQPVTVEVNKNVDGSIDNVGITAESVLPDGYALYDSQASYTVHSNSGNNTGGGWTIGSESGKTGTTYVTGYGGDPSNSTQHASSTGSYNNTTVWFAVTYSIGGLPDTVVIDYGLPVVIDVLGNDQFPKSVTIAGIANGKYAGVENGVGHVPSNQAGQPAVSDTASGSYGIAELIEVDGEQCVRYTLNTSNGMQMQKEEVFTYAVPYQYVTMVNGVKTTQNRNYYSTVTVIPATSIYYEDGFVSYSVWNMSDDERNTDPNKQWAPTPNGSTANQNQDRPGQFSFPEVDANKIYGSDDAYKTMATYSMDSAMKVKVDTATYAEAQFTFWGTGFDIISLTSNTTGTVMADVYLTSEFKTQSGDNYSATPVTYRTVDTYYGYRWGLYNVTYVYNTFATATTADDKWDRIIDGPAASGASERKAVKPANPENGTTVSGVEYIWAPDANATDTLYQVPVLKISGLEYNKYTVVLTASYREGMDHYANDVGYDFYLDAIRIYDPANDGTGNNTVQDAYKDDHEGWPEYFELRNLLISRNDFSNLENGTGSGIVFIDNTVDTNKNTTYKVEDYTNYGPNNEVYLAPGQAVAFDLNVTHTDLDRIHLALKSVGGTANAEVYGLEDQTRMDVSVGDRGSVATATDMYYDITALNGKTVVIRNTGGAILSVTNVKVTYTAAHQDGIEDTFFTTSTQSVEAVMASMLLAEAPGIPGETVPEETVPETTEPEETVPEETIPEETVPEEPTVFEPERFQVELSGDTVKAGSRIVIGVTTGSDVEHIEINGTVITEYLTNRRTGARTWRVKLIAGTVGQQEIRVVCYNAAGQASEAVTRTVTVTERYTSLNNLLEDVLTNFFGGMVKKWD